MSRAFLSIDQNGAVHDRQGITSNDHTNMIYSDIFIVLNTFL